MKKIILFAVACITLAACTKTELDNKDNTPVEQTSFKAGQVVTLNVSVPASSQTKVSGTPNSEGGVEFKWELSDKILVKVGEASSEFTLASGSGQSNASFTGTMPASGDTFDVQFPVSDPVLTSQTYVKDALPHNMMKATATGCTLGSDFTLTPQNAALRLKLYGQNQTIGKIVVKDASSNTYTLSCSGAELPSDAAKADAFYIVVPAVKMSSVEIYDNAETPAKICQFEPAKEVNFTANKVFNMAAKEVMPDLSLPGTANCYIVSEAGRYKFKAVKGNSDTSVGDVKGVKVLWESFGTSSAPTAGDLVKADVSYAGGYIIFNTNDSFKEGNALIAAYSDAACTEGKVLWSWHIWLTDKPAEQVYKNSAGTMMDRNLGATSATPGDVGALGLLYQWGRKDPFLSSSSVSSNTTAASSLTWPSDVTSDSSKGTIAYATANPTTFIKQENSICTDWLYRPTGTTEEINRWQASKTIYDPCPAGWRVPDSNVWFAAFNVSSEFTSDLPWSGSPTYGMDFGSGNGKSDNRKLGSDTSIWYPFAGYRDRSGGSLKGFGTEGNYWSCIYNSDGARSFDFTSGKVTTTTDRRASCQSVRCFKTN